MNLDFHYNIKASNLRQLIEENSIIVFSCFDTLLSTKLSLNNMKRLWAKELLNYLERTERTEELFHIRIEAENKFLKPQSYELNMQLVFNNIAEKTKAWYDLLYSRSDFIDLMMNVEISTQNRAIGCNTQYKELYFYAQKSGKKVIIISDNGYFYKSVLLNILSNYKFDKFHSLYVASDIRTLETHAKDTLILIGKNSYYKDFLSDKGTLVKLSNETLLADQEEKNLNIKSILNNNLKLYSTINENNYENIAFSFYFFIDKLYSLLLKNGVDHVYFLTREGKLFQKLFELYKKRQGYQNFQSIKSDLLWVSRRSTCIASLKELEYETFEFLFSRYRLKSIYDFLQLLNFPEEEIKFIDRIDGVDASNSLENLKTSRNFRLLMECTYFRQLYEKKRIDQKNLIIEYFHRIGVNPSALNIIDIGWYGTIQDQIYQIYNGNCKIHGYYLGYCYTNKDCRLQHNNLKTGVLFNSNMEENSITDLTSMVYYTHSTLSIYLYETFSSCEEGSVLCYTPDGFVLEKNQEEIDTYRIIRPTQKKILDIFEQLLMEFSLTPITYKHYEKIFRNIHIKLIRPLQDLKPKYGGDGVIEMRLFMIDKNTHKLVLR